MSPVSLFFTILELPEECSVPHIRMPNRESNPILFLLAMYGSKGSRRERKKGKFSFGLFVNLA